MTQHTTGNSKQAEGNEIEVTGGRRQVDIMARAAKDIRPMIQFVPSETFESQTAEARKRMTTVRSRDTIKRNGWYYTEKCTAEEYPVGA